MASRDRRPDPQLVDAADTYNSFGNIKMLRDLVDAGGVGGIARPTPGPPISGRGGGYVKFRNEQEAWGFARQRAEKREQREVCLWVKGARTPMKGINLGGRSN